MKNRKITIDEQTACQLFSLYQNCEAADAITLPCQNQIFRDRVRGAYQAQNVQRAFEILEKFLKEGEDHDEANGENDTGNG